ncbi:MAG TPA: molybdopterin-dependent oxidoreductase [Chloroflexaceae bacterium]|nr:molybdopterin-dependent oxidoreductase [Chloroflexaceae bacterium]
MDWALALALAASFGTGLWSLTAGRPDQAWVVGLHAGAGLMLALLLGPKLRRVWPRLRARERRAWPGLAATLLVLAVLATGVGWTAGGALFFLGYNLLNWHILLGFALVAAASAHMLARARPLRRPDLAGRRQALALALVLAGGALLRPAKEALTGALGLAGARRRFTGSRAWAHHTGNGFPVVSWVADRPRLLDTAAWRLRVGGLVARPLELDLAALDLGHALEATLDCTGGFYTTQGWAGATVGALLDRAGADPAARWVRFVSVTGYRWSLPVEQARAALVATRVGGEPLAHGHGAPARLVAPGERGFVWVKWLVAVELLAGPDPGQLAAINTSWLSPAGRGEA